MKLHPLSVLLLKKATPACSLPSHKTGWPGIQKAGRRRLAAVFLACWLAAVSAAQAAVLVSYSGGTDPSLQGWSKKQGPSTEVSAGPASDNGTPVWQIINKSGDSGNSHELNYKYIQSTDQFMSGWSLKASLRVVGSNIGANSQITLGYVSLYKTDGTLNTGNNRSLYAMNFGAAPATGYTVVMLSGDSTPYTVSSGGYHDFELRYTPSLNAVEFLIDGTVMRNDYLGNTQSYSSTVNNYVFWGNGASAAAARTANYSSIEFSVVPEPGTVGLSLLGFGCLALASFGKAFRPGAKR